MGYDNTMVHQKNTLSYVTCEIIVIMNHDLRDFDKWFVKEYHINNENRHSSKHNERQDEKNYQNIIRNAVDFIWISISQSNDESLIGIIVVTKIDVLREFHQITAKASI